MTIKHNYAAQINMIIGWRVKAEDRQEWSKVVVQTKTHPGLQSQ
jgi:hypothetical protein